MIASLKYEILICGLFLVSAADSSVTLPPLLSPALEEEELEKIEGEEEEEEKVVPNPCKDTIDIRTAIPKTVDRTSTYSFQQNLLI